MLSLIVPFYNSAASLGLMLNSILAQSFTDCEILLVDDGSLDASLEIANSFAQRDNRIKVLHQNNKGVSCARNMGIENATGDLICFVDADDALMPNALSRMVKGMEDSSIDLFIGGYVVKNENERIVYSIPENDVEILSREDGIEQMYYPHPFRYQGYIWNKMFRRSVIEKNHIRFDESIYFNEDRLFVTQYISAQTGEILFDTTPVYIYYERSCGAMASINNGFNPKYVTDFDAMIKMLKGIRHVFHNDALVEMAEDGVLNSYSRIHNMMESAGGIQRRIHQMMKIKLCCALSPSYLIRKKIELLSKR